MTQLTLAFPHQDTYRAQDLLPHAGQDEARAWLGRTAAWPLGRLVLWGPSGSGKTHLLHAWAATEGAEIVSQAPHSWPDRAIAIDGIDAGPLDEIALLHLLNAAAEARHPVLLASVLPPARLPVRLPDLGSRLRATTAVTIGPAPDAFLEMLLARLLAERQLRLPTSLQAWLLTRLPRSPAALRTAVATLDAAALESHRTITRTLAASVLGLYDRPDATPPAAPHPPSG